MGLFGVCVPAWNIRPPQALQDRVHSMAFRVRLPSRHSPKGQALGSDGGWAGLCQDAEKGEEWKPLLCCLPQAGCCLEHSTHITLALTLCMMQSVSMWVSPCSAVSLPTSSTGSAPNGSFPSSLSSPLTVHDLNACPSLLSLCCDSL